MKLRNKKTGDVFNFVIKAETDITESHFKLRTGSGGWEDGLVYGSLEELNKEWEDYEEPKEYWRITDLGELKSIRLDQHQQNVKKSKQIGNYFGTREEAEKAVEKLKAWKRLKDKGFKFSGLQKELKDVKFDIAPATIKFNKGGDFNWFIENRDDLDLLFGGKE